MDSFIRAPLNASIVWAWNVRILCAIRWNPCVNWSFQFQQTSLQWIRVCLCLCLCILVLFQCLSDWHPNELKIRKESTNNSRGANEKRRKSTYIFLFVLLFVRTLHTDICVCSRKKIVWKNMAAKDSICIQIFLFLIFFTSTVFNYNIATKWK